MMGAKIGKEVNGGSFLLASHLGRGDQSRSGQGLGRQLTKSLTWHSELSKPGEKRSSCVSVCVCV